MKNRITINDIAKKLNVTPATVSRALSNHPEISIKTKKLVLETADQLHYQRNNVASSLRSGRTHLIGVLIPSAAHSFFGEVIHGITNLANENGYDVLIHQSNETHEGEVKGIKALMGARVDGILASIAKDTIDYSHFAHVKKQHVPIAFFDRVNDDLGIPSVSVNDYLGAYMATEHLLKQGYKRVAHISGQQHHKIFNDRVRGYMGALQANHVKFDPGLLFQGDITMEGGQQGVQYFFHLPHPPDAIFAVEDYAALGALTELKKRNINVPEQVGLFGFCNDLFSEHITPGLSTIDQQTTRMGQEAFKLIFDMINHKGQEDYLPRKVVLDPVPVIRQSSLRNTPLYNL